MMFRDQTSRAMQAPGKTQSHQPSPVMITCRPSETSPPQVGSGGRMPSPRKERPASAMIAKPAPSETCTMTGWKELGRT